MKKLINFLHRNKLLGSLVHTLDYCLQRELKDCTTVLDLGCGFSSPLQYCKWIKYSVGVEIFEPYLKLSKEKEIHTDYIMKAITDVNFEDKSFDAVIMIEVLEHLPEEVGLQIMEKAKKWAKKKIIITSPNGFINQKEVDKNPYQKHLSGWNYRVMSSLGFKCKGLAGIKFLRHEVENETMGDDLTTSIRFRPKAFWFLVATVSQVITYHLPSWAFELFSVYYL